MILEFLKAQNLEMDPWALYFPACMTQKLL